MKYIILIFITACSQQPETKSIKIAKEKAIDSVSILFEPWQQSIIYSAKFYRDSLRALRELEYKCDSFDLLHSLTNVDNLTNPRGLDSILNDRYRDSVNHYLSLLWRSRKSEARLKAGLSSK